uniref:Uncharacterized protein n=1 Tax=Zea mays TaxID=4577 RepID=C0PBF7_MAIZE|nr:unknown [Zea mays]
MSYCVLRVENLTRISCQRIPPTENRRAQTSSEASSSASSSCCFGGGVPSVFLTAAGFSASLCSSAL